MQRPENWPSVDHGPLLNYIQPILYRKKMFLNNQPKSSEEPFKAFLNEHDGMNWVRNEQKFKFFLDTFP